MNRSMTVSAFVVAALAGTAFGQKMPLLEAMQVQAQRIGVLSIVSTAGQQQIEVTIGPAPGNVTVQGVPSIPSGLVFTDIDTIELRTGNAQDFVAFRILTEVVPDITVNTAGGLSDVIFDYQIPFTLAAASSNVVHNGGTASDKVAILAQTDAASFVGNWTMNHGAGNNETVVTANSTSASDNLSLNVNSTSTTGVDKIEMLVISAAANLSINLGGNMGGNADFASLIVDGLGPATTTSSFNLDLGAGQDAASVEILSRGGTTATSGSVAGGAGLDSLVFKLEGDGALNAQYDGGADADLVDFSLKGNITGSPRLLGGTGNDELKITVDGPQTATPFLDGGPGFDKAFGFGTIINCEDVSF